MLALTSCWTNSQLAGDLRGHDLMWRHYNDKLKTNLHKVSILKKITHVMTRPQTTSHKSEKILSGPWGLGNVGYPPKSTWNTNLAKSRSQWHLIQLPNPLKFFAECDTIDTRVPCKISKRPGNWEIRHVGLCYIVTFPLSIKVSKKSAQKQTTPPNTCITDNHREYHHMN